MKQFLRYLHWINLDTAVGAVVTSLFIAKSLDTEIPDVAALTLFLAVLSIYNFDHLMDARRLPTKARTTRHRFYQQHLRSLSIYQLILMLGLITIIWYLPNDILRAGLVLSLVTGIYFVLLFFVYPGKFMLKEIMIALVYSLALFLAPLYSDAARAVDNNWLIFWLQIFLMAVSNTLIFAWYDHQIDLAEGHTSLANNLGKNIVYKLVLSLIGLSALLIVYQLLTAGEVARQLILLAMTMVLLYSLMAHKKLRKNDRYRVLGDAVFMIPILIYLL